jgi:spore photoproduct lyase
VKPFVPDAVWIERSELDSPLAQEVVARVEPGIVHLLDDGAAVDVKSFSAGKRQLVLQRHRGSFLRHCPAGTAGLVCCNYLVVNLASNCPFDCSYCFLQEYLANNPTMKAYTNVNDALQEIDVLLRAHPERSFRIGTGELADSLALDPLTALSHQLVPFFAERANALLELKTKTDSVEELLRMDPKGRVVVSWSVNPPGLIAAEEHGTASLDERLSAARRVQQAGYRVGFHFDPLIEIEGWEEAYAQTVDEILRAVDRRSIAWISLGSLRLSPALRQASRGRVGNSMILGGVLVPCPDGKARVWRGLRTRMYRLLVERLKQVSGDVPIYLCMEPPAMWDRVMGSVPGDRQLGVRLAGGVPW